jgi:alpha-mannosidase
MDSSSFGMRFGRTPATTPRSPADLQSACHSPLFLRPRGKKSRTAIKLRIDNEDVLLQECKRSADGSAWIVRLFGAAGEDRKASLTWTDDTPIKIWRSNLREQPLEMLGSQVEVRAWELVTLRIEALSE